MSWDVCHPKLARFLVTLALACLLTVACAILTRLTGWRWVDGANWYLAGMLVASRHFCSDRRAA